MRKLHAPGHVSETRDDAELESEVVRHARPDDRPAMAMHSNAEDLPAIETVSSSVNIRYDADDLEIPAFLRKRGDS